MLSMLGSFASVMQTIGYIVLAVCVLLLMVLLHELGHYIVGRILKFKITEFSIGFGKVLFQRTNKRGEKISLRLFPLGGFCAFAGEDDVDDDAENKDSQNIEEIKNKDEINLEDIKPLESVKKDTDLKFNEQKPWKRILVYLAGVTFNFLSAFIFSFILLVSTGYGNAYVVTNVNGTNIDFLKPNEIILSINDIDIDYVYGNTLETIITKDTPEPIKLKVKAENGEIREIELYKVTYMVDKKDENGETVKDSDGNIVKESVTNYGLELAYTNVRYSFGGALARCVPYTFQLGGIIVKSLWLVLTFQVPLKDLGGPITTVSMIAHSASYGLASFLWLLPLLAANLAVFNLIPFPALDGSHVIFTTIEWIRKKPINRKVEAYIHFIGLCILFAFVVVVDIIHLVA